MLTKWMNQDRFPVIEKQSEAGVVAYIKFEGLHEIAKNIWKLRDWLNSNDLHPAGSPSCTLYFPKNIPSFEAGAIPCELQWPVAEAPRSTSNGIGLKIVAPHCMLATFHLGDTTTTDQSFHFMEQVITAEGYLINGPSREVYLFDVSQPKSRWITEIQIYVEKKEKE